MWDLFNLKKMNGEERPNFCQRCGQKLISANAFARDYSVIKNAYKKCPDCGWKEENKNENKKQGEKIMAETIDQVRENKNGTCSYCGKKMIADSGIHVSVGFGSETKVVCSDPECESHKPIFMISQPIPEELENEND